MDKLLDAIGEIFKSLFTVSPATAVLFLIVCAMGFVIRHLYKRITDLQTQQVSKQEDFQKAIIQATESCRKEYDVKLEAKECEITALHERTFERDQSNAKILEGLRIAMRNSNHRAMLQSLWNGLEGLGKHHQLDIRRDMNMYDHIRTVTLDE